MYAKHMFRYERGKCQDQTEFMVNQIRKKKYLKRLTVSGFLMNH